MLRECVVLVTVCVFGVGSLSGQGFFCRDPDTGKLHPANATWSATTFCGKYHCKLKRKNITSSQYAPLRQLNITNIPLLDNNVTIVDVTKKEVSVKKEEAVKTVFSTDNKTEPDIVERSNNTLKTNKPLTEYQITTPDNIVDDKNASNKDRFLSEQEIKSLTEILHTLKKGDLDAILEIYNLAQDIYKELDKKSTDQLLQEAMSTAETLNKQIFKTDMFKKMTNHNDASYWYEPLASSKIKIAEILRPEIISNDINPEIPAIPVTMNIPSLPAAVNVVPKPTESNVVAQMSLLPPISGMQMRKMSESFFNGPLTYKDFGKLPYYYPMSNFQRSSSYKHEQKTKLTATVGPSAPTPASTLEPAPVPTLVQKPVTNFNKTLQIGVKYQKEPTPFIFLPHPLTIMRNYNWTFPQNMYHRLETRRNEQSHFDQIEVLRREDNLYGSRRKEENISDKLEFLNKEENLFNQLGTHRKAENFGGHIGKRRRQDNLSDKLDILTKEENLFNQLGTRRKQENLPDKLEFLGKEANFFNQLGSRREEENFVDQIGTRKNQDNLSDKLELATKSENLFNQLGTRKKEANLFGKLAMDTLGREDNKITINRRSDKKSNNNILMHPDLENFKDLQLRPSMKEENTVNTNTKQQEGEKGHRLIDRPRPDWQTDSLPQQILDEVRAHIQEKQRVFMHHIIIPLRKKVKLERVGKLLNMDKITRVKRSDEKQGPPMDSVDEPLAPELYEVFIESITCNADYEIPGYFRYGNLSQPYPDCCPQRIPTDKLISN